MKLFKNLDFEKLKKGLDKTRTKIAVRVNEALSGKAQLDDATIEELEEILVTSDVGIDTAAYIIDRTRESLIGERSREQEGIIKTLKKELVDILDIHDDDGETEPEKISNYKPYIVLIVGVNGVGKTTTIGKLAHNFKMSGLNVLIGSADTFRAAANEQLDVWAKRAGVNIINSKSGADPSSVAFDTLNAAKNMNSDVVLIDTAGRLHTKSNLMEELGKIKRVMKKVYDYAPNEVYLVLDANTGQNAILQVNEFKKYTDLTGFIVTKLDGTAKGGVIFQLCMDKNIPIKYIGVGEGMEDLQNFDSNGFVEALFGSEAIN